MKADPMTRKWKLVPVEATEEMVAAFCRQKNTGTQEIGTVGDKRSDYDAYSAMLSVSPAPGEDVELMMRVRFAVSDPGRVVGARDANETLQNWQARAVLKALEG